MKTPRGFTTVEMMLAVYLLAIGITTAAYMIPTSTKALGQSKLFTQAAFFAQQRLEEALASPSAETVKVHPDVPELTGEISSQGYSGNVTLVRAVVYRTGDWNRRPLVQIETLEKGGP